jgi:hypothetical protein
MQHAKKADYGRVNAFMSGKAQRKRITRGERQALNRMVYDSANFGGRGTMISLENGKRVNIYALADGRKCQAVKLNDGTGDWMLEKCRA